jgi:type IV pilus assembly protein PilM
VNVAVSGPWVIIRIVEMPVMKPGEMRQALPFEAQRYLPFNIQDVVVDGAALGPIDAHKAWTLVVACKKELLERRLDWAKRAGLSIAIVDVDALAVANSFLASGNGKPRAGTCAVINAGAQLTNLIIFQGEIPYLVRDIPWGAEKLARNVAEQLGKSPPAIAQALLQPELSPDVQNAAKLATEVLVTELQLSFDYFENRFGHPPEALFVSGGLGECPGFLGALKSHLTQPVSLWVPAEGLSGRFAVAHGLALRTG